MFKPSPTCDTACPSHNHRKSRILSSLHPVPHSTGSEAAVLPNDRFETATVVTLTSIPYLHRDAVNRSAKATQHTYLQSCMSTMRRFTVIIRSVRAIISAAQLGPFSPPQWPCEYSDHYRPQVSYEERACYRNSYSFKSILVRRPYQIFSVAGARRTHSQMWRL